MPQDGGRRHGQALHAPGPEHAPGLEHTPAQDQSISTWPGQNANADAAQSHKRRLRPPFSSV